MARGTRLEAVSEEPHVLVGEESPPAPKPEPVSSAFATKLLITSLRALSQRALVALMALEALLIIGSAFVVWLMVISRPTVEQLIAVGLYGLFSLVALHLRRS